MTSIPLVTYTVHLVVLERSGSETNVGILSSSLLIGPMWGMWIPIILIPFYRRRYSPPRLTHLWGIFRSFIALICILYILRSLICSLPSPPGAHIRHKRRAAAPETQLNRQGPMKLREVKGANRVQSKLQLNLTNLKFSLQAGRIHYQR